MASFKTYRSIGWSICLLALCHPFSMMSQTRFPRFDSNVPVDERQRSEIIAHLEPLETALIQSLSCYWSGRQTSTILRLKNDKWREEHWTIHYTDRNRTEIKHISKKRKRLKANVDSMLIKLDALSFWNIAQDSLNISEYQLNDTTTISTSITDGCVREIAVIDRGEYRRLWAYEPERFQEFVYVPARERFIQAFQLIRYTLTR
jgi:7-cyano-7-deazaguanine synthase in queuosine biosynthesis